MDKTLVKILNMATSGSFEESNIAIEQAYKYMKKKGTKLEDLNFNGLYNGHIVAIKMIARFSYEQPNQKDQASYISSWTRTVYGTGSKGGSNREVMLVNQQKKKLEVELKSVKNQLVQAQFDLQKEQDNVENYLETITQKHKGLIAALAESESRVKSESERYNHRIKILERDLKKATEKDSKVSEVHDYMIHAKELQINNIRKELKVLLGNLRYSALQPLVSNR
jgi:hypothetical protein